MNTYYTNENRCEVAFRNCGPLWHLYTNGKDAAIIFASDDDFRFGINALCFVSIQFPDIRILAFELMNNHIHAVLAGELNRIEEFFNKYRIKLLRGLPETTPSSFKMSLKPLTDLRAARNVIVYTERNGYVANSRYTPFTYPWGVARFYFNPLLKPEDTLASWKVDARRRMFRGRNPELSDDTQMINGHVSPKSFCDIELGESLFRDAHHYFMTISKSVESYAEVAVGIGDDSFMTEEELYSAATRRCMEIYGASKISSLTKDRKITIARYLHYDLKAKNSQIRMILGLTQSEIDAIFPQ